MAAEFLSASRRTRSFFAYAQFVKNQLEPNYSTKPIEFVSDANYIAW